MPAMAAPIKNEQQQLIDYLQAQRSAIRAAVHGLTDEEARRTPTRSELSVGGLVKHLTIVDKSWADLVAGTREAANPPTDPAEQQQAFAEWTAGFSLGPDETLAGALEAYEKQSKASDRIYAAVSDLDQDVPVPDAPWYPDDLEFWTVRWVILHMIEETARHAGHADILRECIDGATAFPLMAAAEGWPETGFVKPWRRDGDNSRNTDEKS